jgi:HEAT repeat protein
MSGKVALDKKIEALRALRDSPASAEKDLRRALQDRNGFFVSKAAALVGELHLTALVPDLESAFERFLKDPVKTDPQCWAKIAIAKALHGLEHKDPHVFLLGLNHVQREPVWGGDADTAGPLRGASAIALVQCRLTDLEILTHLTAGLADPEKTVRLDTASAIAALGSETGALLLRLKTLLGDREPDVMGQCFVALLDLGSPAEVQFIARFLSPGQEEDIQSEAIAALAQAKAEGALEVLQTAWRGRLSHILRRALILSLAGSPLPASADFLLTVLKDESGETAEWVIEALGLSRYRSRVEAQVRSLVDQLDEPKLRQAFSRHFPASL